MKQNKTNVMRLLEAAGVEYKPLYYDLGDTPFSGEAVCEALGVSAEESFKTLCARGERTGINVFVIPVAGELDHAALFCSIAACLGSAARLGSGLEVEHFFIFLHKRIEYGAKKSLVVKSAHLIGLVRVLFGVNDLEYGHLGRVAVVIKRKKRRIIASLIGEYVEYLKIDVVAILVGKGNYVVQFVHRALLYKIMWS